MGTPAAAGRVLTGSAFAPVLSGPALPPSRPLVRDGNGQTERPASLLFIRFANPSPDGRSLRSRRCLFQFAFAPCLMGGKTGRFALSRGREYAAFRDGPPSVPVGDTGEKGKKGIAGSGASVGRRKAPHGPASTDAALLDPVAHGYGHSCMWHFRLPFHQCPAVPLTR